MTEKAYIPRENDTSEISGGFSNQDVDRVAQAGAIADYSPDVVSGISGNFSPQVIAAYENLLEQEAEPADPDEIIHLHVLKPDSLEYARLIEAGVSPSTIDSSNLTRKVLREAGFAFLNKIGGGEKPLIAGTIEMEDGSLLDAGQRTLLTDVELEAVKRSQDPLDMATNEQIRLAMIDFLQASKEAVHLEPEIKKAMFQKAQERILDSGNEENIALLAGLIFDSSDYKLALVIDHCAVGLDITKIGGVPVDMFASRSSILRGTPSPFLDSGYHFDTNDDVTIYPEDPTKTRRLNSVVVHLLSRGLNEQGTSINDSHDQTYITNRGFKELVASLDDLGVGSYDDEAIEIFTARLLEDAKKEAT